MPNGFSFPTNSQLTLVAQTLLPVNTMDSPIFKHFPVRTEDTDLIQWEQFDRFKGLQAARGLGGQPNKVEAVGLSRYEMQPGYFAEFMTIDEKDLTRLRVPGSYNAPLNLSTLVAQKQSQLMTRQIQQITRILWTLLANGTISVANGAGLTLYSESYTFQTISGSAWGTPATGTPLADFRAVQLKHRGYSVRLDRSATAYMNQVTFNKLAANTNSADIYGKRTAGLATPLGVAEVNVVLAGENLPQIEIYDEGYQDESDTFVPYIADNKTIFVGARTDGSALGAYTMTRNASNPNSAPGQHSYVIDSADKGQKTPHEFEVHLGHNGGPICEFPSAVVVLTTT